jgi:predicted O-linked N-acetylglucosamine transferase (SPINDLY family)
MNSGANAKAGDVTLTVEQALQQAVSHHQAGRLQEAEQLYRAVLQARPDQADANHNLGVMAVQVGQPLAGLPHLKAALEANPSQGQYWLSYAKALLAADQPTEALMVMQTAIQSGLDSHDARQLMQEAEATTQNTHATHLPEMRDQALQQQTKSGGIFNADPLPQSERNQLDALVNAGRIPELERLAQLLSKHYPDSGFIWKVLGVSLQIQGKEGLIPLQKAAELLPDDAEVHSNLGNALQDLGQLDSAVASFRRALSIKPDYADTLYNLGNALQAQGKLDSAVACYHQARSINPDDIKVYSNLGLALHAQGKQDAAVESFHHALLLKPDYAEAHNNLGNALKDQGKLDEAVGHFHKALLFKQNFAEAHNNLGNAFKDQGRLDEAIEHYRKALAINPDYVEAHSNLLFVLNVHANLSSEDIFRAALKYEALIGAPLRPTWPMHSNDRNPDRRLRIGYVSPDFRRHAVAFFAEPIFANHDKSQVEIFCYAEILREDETTARFRRMADHWHSTVGLSDDAAANMIREHQIDILIDLAGHTAHNRLPVFARKPAPIQLTYLGYPGTTGLSAMDYRITDHYADPDGTADAFYSERLLRLPDSLCCYRPSADMQGASPLPALARGYLTFGSFNNFNKVDQPTLEVWAELLRALPASHLMMLTVPEGEARQRLVSRFAELGIDAQRLEFHGKLPSAEFHRKFLEVDISLDPVTVSGGTTTCESLWMGVPVIAFVGKRFITRVSYSFLSTTGLGDFAAFSPEDSIRIAAHLAENLPLLVEIRAGLREHLRASPLVDEAGFTRNLEALYRDVWGKWCGAT